MADYKQILIKYGIYIELAAYLLALISIFLPFKCVVKERSYGKRNDVDVIEMDDSVIKEIYSEIDRELSKYNKSGNASFINFTSGVFVFIFIFISAVIVAINTFTENIIIKIKEKINFKFFDIVIELVPLALTIISFILTLIGTDNYDKIIELNIGRIKLATGFFLLLIAIIVAIAVRVAYLLLVKDIINICRKTKYEPTEKVFDQSELEQSDDAEQSEKNDKQPQDVV